MPTITTPPEGGNIVHQPAMIYPTGATHVFIPRAELERYNALAAECATLRGDIARLQSTEDDYRAAAQLLARDEPTTEALGETVSIYECHTLAARIERVIKQRDALRARVAELERAGLALSKIAEKAWAELDHNQYEMTAGDLMSAIEMLRAAVDALKGETK